MDHYFTYQSANCYYRSEGEGIAVVLIHGFAEDHTVWNRQVAFLKKHCKVIMPDLPGSGNSEVIHYPLSAVVIEHFADYIYAVLQHAGINTCIMLGHSMGGYITLSFAQKHPENLLGFGFVHSTAFADNEEKKAVRLRAIGTMAAYGSAAFVRSTTPNTFGTTFKKEHPEEVEALVERGKNFTVEALQQYYTAMMKRPDRTGVLANSKVPVLFIIGLEDAAAPASDVLKQVHLPAEAHVHTIAGVGHMGMWEATNRVNEFVLQFVQYIQQTAGNKG
ncbi:alpha/beta hydrolase [Ilyomonas limi]|uniref:Alpha/beta hydrolase n=1 Tax=Ilyomonas limi TaxID=2575867 RepID=A0A4U3KY16_9BACT|nr:alpha/beta hydrolase [Ilyomonas limi]TKK67518.1 alpha/beta hydrolase [Ilyomonas limi]